MIKHRPVLRPGFQRSLAFLALSCLAVPLLTLVVAGPAGADKNLTVTLPAGGQYQVWLEAETTSGPQAQAPAQVTGDRAALPLPAPPTGLKEWRVLALDEKSGYAAARTLPAKDTPAEVNFTTTDFNRVHHVRVQVTGAAGKPVASAGVTLAPAKGGTLSRVIDAGAAGVADFTDVSSGTARLTVTPTGGKSTTKEVDINLPKGETTQQIAIPLPEVTAVVEAPATSTTAGTTAASDSKAAPETRSGTPANPTGTESPAPPAPTPAPTAGGSEAIGTLVGLIFVFAVLYVLFLHARNQGWTVDKTLARLGVQPVSPIPAGSVPGSPTPAPPPPVDPNVCPFCGQRKDPLTGACACSLDTAPAGAAPLAGGAFASSGSGPRLVAVSGAAMGQIFPVNGEATIGRDSGNVVALPMDSTVSRRHAVISPADGGFVIRDQGSSNGTYVNGARVAEAPLQGGDEVSIGGTRFRFEV